jgi:prolyl-tRNA editing enzyme YbaK/EbsC (Cys-tRNA(Pro) deacylase)
VSDADDTTGDLLSRLGVYAARVEREALPEPVQRVARYLVEARAEARLEEFPEGTSSAEDAARAVGCELGQIVKSLVWDCDGRLVVVLVPGDRRADGGKVAAALGCIRAKVARPQEIQAATGFEPGAVAPFALSRAVDAVLVDRLLLGRDVVWVGAGSDRHVAGLAPAELVRLSRARAVDLVDASR